MKNSDWLSRDNRKGKVDAPEEKVAKESSGGVVLWLLSHSFGITSDFDEGTSRKEKIAHYAVLQLRSLIF